jgi:hypothetical protein
MKLKKTLAILAIGAATSVNCYAGDWWLAVGSAPSDSGGGTSAAIGLKGEGNFGFEFGAVFNTQFSGDVLDYPVPHSNYTDLGTKRTGTAFGVDGLYFFGDGKSLRPYGGVGVYYSPRKDIAQSNATGWYYNQSDQSSVFLSGELGVQLVTSGGLTLGAGYHTVRGANITIGKAF